MGKLKILINAIAGEAIKASCDLLPIGWFVNMQQNNPERIVVSLTSYGDRVSRTVKYTLLSMLRQTMRPDEIVLWLDTEQWRERKLPSFLKKMERYGVVVKYCPDNIKSYTKLIPSLKEYPNDIIITVDDDIFYSKHLVEHLYAEHLKNKENICAVQFVVPTFSEDGSLKTYREWPEYDQPVRKSVTNTKLIFPQGVGGVLYPSHVFSEEVFNSEVFKKYCRFADDVWFFIMGILNGKDKSFVSKAGMKCYNIDLFRQVMQKDRLHDANANQGGNDVQMQNVMKHYKIDIHDYE